MLGKISTDMLSVCSAEADAIVKDDHLILFPQTISFPFFVVRK